MDGCTGKNAGIIECDEISETSIMHLAVMDMKERDEQYRDWREEVYLLVRDKTVGEVKFAIAVADSIFRYKDEFLD